MFLSPKLGGMSMKKKNYKGRCEKRMLEKSEKEIHVIKKSKSKNIDIMTIREIVQMSKEENEDIIKLLKENFTVVEVKV